MTEGANRSLHRLMRAVRRQHPGRRVLVVDDDLACQAISRALLDAAGLACECADHGHEALARLDNGPACDLVLMDMQMPVLDGPATARALRARGDDVPVIALTGNALAEHRRHCLDAGMDEHLTKPVDPAALYAALLQWLGRRSVQHVRQR